MKNKKIVLILIVFLFVNLLSLVNFSNANFSNIVEKRIQFKITEQDLLNSDFYINNQVTKSSLRVASASEIDENYSTRYYFNQLANQMSKDIYNGLVENADSKDVITIDTDMTISVPATDDETLSNEYNNNIKPYIYDAFCAFVLDNPELYWIGYSGVDGEVIADINDETKEIIVKEASLQITQISEINNIDEFNTKFDEASTSITGDNFYDITKNIHDYICKNVQTPESEPALIERTAYGALINNNANSEGQANLFTLLCREKGINAVSIKGKVSDNDAQWVAVYQPDEKAWYGVDVALDNIDDGYNYFLVGNNKEINGVKFSESHIANVLAYDEQKTVFKAPALTNFNYGEFGVSVQYSITEPTNDNVVVTITGNREMKEVEGWTLSSDKMTLEKTYTKNTTETVSITSENNETIEQEIVVQNIDKKAPEISVQYSSTDPTTGPVKVILTSDEELQEVEGWTLSSDKKSLEKTYTQNTSETVIVKDLVGNQAEVNISISNISKETFECKVDYSETAPTNQDVVVTISSDGRELQEVEGWTLSSDKKQLTKSYSNNTEETVTVTDISGNTSLVDINISNIDKQRPSLQFSYSTVEMTNQNVIVTITSDEPLKQPEGWSISEDKCTVTKTYYENTTDVVIIEDLAGNGVEENISINNIDKTPPELTLDYQTSGNQITVTITSNEPVKQPDGWSISEDKLTLTKTYTEDEVEVLDVEDLVGNVTEVMIEVSSTVTSGSGSSTNNQNGQNNDDNTIANMPIPQTGVISLIIIISIVAVISIILYLKYKKYDSFTRNTRK